MSNIKFKGKTNDGYILRLYTEMLQNCINTAQFMFNEEGIFLRTMDANAHLLIDSALYKKNFLIYNCKESFTIGINVLHLFKTLKSLKKKDILKLIVTNDNKLIIKYIPKDGGKTVQTELMVTPVEAIPLDTPLGYKNQPIIVYSDQFQKMGKDMKSTCKHMIVTATNISITFTVHNMYKTSQTFSVYDNEDIEEETIKDNEEVYNATFSESNLNKFMKITNTSTIFHIYAEQGLPLLFKIPIGSLGELKVYIKSNEEIKNEKDMDDEEEDAEEDTYTSV